MSDDTKKNMQRTLDLIDEVVAVTELKNKDEVFGIDPYDHLVRLIERTKAEIRMNCQELKTLLTLVEQTKKDRHR